MKRQCAYAVAAPSSLGIRLAPLEHQQVQTSHLFFLQATSAESNTLSIPAALGLPVKALSRYVADDPVSAFIRRDMRSRGITCDGVTVQRDTPWGVRHPCNIAESGFGLRGPHVTNDRAGEVGGTLAAADFDFHRLFGEEGVQILHISGLIAAISPQTAEFCLALARAAKQYGTTVCFDTNYRPSLWKGRETELLGVFDELASLSDILFGGDILQEKKSGAPPYFGLTFSDTSSRMAGARYLIEQARAGYPQAQIYLSTVREVCSVNRHRFGAVAWQDGVFTELAPQLIPVYDRIGGGDAFVGGFLYGTVKGWSMSRKLEFACGCTALVSGLADDYGLPASEAQIWNLRTEDAWTQR